MPVGQEGILELRKVFVQNFVSNFPPERFVRLGLEGRMLRKLMQGFAVPEGSHQLEVGSGPTRDAELGKQPLECSGRASTQAERPITLTLVAAYDDFIEGDIKQAVRVLRLHQAFKIPLSTRGVELDDI